ncbi:MAG: hypothetical protein GY764_07175 [Halieaceae bacterium]|nr:hypothetical protein [Halieaceae bacterium]MCP4466842.1 hypothetical protein [Halieaceae bacterium]MCP4841948.1 hypothetical protein [Halieaceae bacterium]MDG2412774.1 hypothetical protein [Halioglobus sp.]
MPNLLLLLLLIFGGVALMVFLGQRFAAPADSQRMEQLRRWLIPLVGLSLVLSLLKYYL